MLRPIPISASISIPGFRRFKYHGTGVSSDGNLQAALANAIDSVAKQSPYMDGLMSWEIIKISGKQGGFIGENTIQVEIGANY